ncbi:P43 5S RNA-binding protein-like [Arapaima gigas]
MLLRRERGVSAPPEGNWGRMWTREEVWLDGNGIKVAAADAESRDKMDGGLRGQRLRCPQEGCGATFSRLWRLKEHENGHTGARPLCCPVPGCGRTFSRRCYLDRHKLCHSPEKCYRCTYEGCGGTFSNSNILRRHVHYAHGDKDKYFQCSYPDCTVTFRKRKAYKMHLNVHSPEPRFKCLKDGCRAAFLTPAARRAHERTHSGYPCPEPGCQVVESTWGKLCKHVHQHPVTRTCKLCQLNFSSRAALRRHQHSHTVQKPTLQCPRDGCQASFSTAFSLEHHIRKVHLQLFKYTCYYPDCSRTFAMESAVVNKCIEYNPPPPRPGFLQPRPSKSRQKRLKQQCQFPLVEDNLQRFFSQCLHFSHKTKLEVDLSGLFNERKIPHQVNHEVNLHNLFSLTSLHSDSKAEEESTV